MLELPLDWSLTPNEDPNWTYQLNAMYPLAPMFQQLEQEFNHELYEFIRTVFDDWIAFNLEQDNDHPFRWNDMATGIRAAYLAQLIWYEQRYVHDETHRARLLYAAQRHLDVLSDPENLSESNHGLFQLVGIAALCHVLDAGSCSEDYAYARREYARLFWKQFNAEGMHLEHSPEYQLLAINVYTNIEDSGLLSLAADARSALDLAKMNLHYLMHPDGGFAELGDTEADSSSRAGVYDSRAEWLLSGGARGHPPDPGVSVFSASGYAIARSGDGAEDTYVILSTAHHSRAHKHLDTASFEWSDRGYRVLVDSGKWGYGPSRERDYVLSQHAHNTIETEGADLSPGDIPDVPYGLSGTEKQGVFVLEADVVLPRSLIDAELKRVLVAKPGEWLIVVDLLREFLSSRQIQWFQLHPDTTLVRSGTGFDLSVGGSGRMMQVFSLVPDLSSLVGRGETEPRMLGWYSPEYGALVPSWQLGFEQSGREIRFATVFRWLEAQRSRPRLKWREMPFSKDVWRLCWLEGIELEGVELTRIADSWEIASCE